MERRVENIIYLDWPFEGRFEAKIVNGVIDEVNFCEIGAGNEECGKCLNSIDFKHLSNIHKALEDLFRAVEEQQKLLGYSFSKYESKPENDQQLKTEHNDKD